MQIFLHNLCFTLAREREKTLLRTRTAIREDLQGGRGNSNSPNFYAKRAKPVTSARWLISWVGGTDHEAAEGRLEGDMGPIATALKSDPGYDRVYLLTNYSHERSARYCNWLAALVEMDPDQIDLFDIELSSPVDYDAIHSEVSANLTAARLPREGVELTFHLSPGTPAMAVIWVVLSRTRFPARLIQTVRGGGVHEVNFFTDIADAFLPEYLRRSETRIGKLAAGPKDTPAEFARILHKSELVAKQVELARRVAAFDVPVLILGETGTGKELFAKAIHAASQRAARKYIPVNCGAISSDLANSDLFGHKKGAFTGADRDRKGHFEEAQGGTLFLDEVGDLPLDTQVRLLRVLEAKEVTPVGSSKPIHIDVRVIAATHRDLMTDVTAGRFREDLFHRLAVGILHLPPLRSRSGDIELLIDHFLNQINVQENRNQGEKYKKISEDGKSILLSYPWPGNVRELYHTLLRAVIWSSSTLITSDDARAALLQKPTQPADLLELPITQDFNIENLLDDVKRHYLRRALEVSGGKKTVAAKLLGLTSHQTLNNWIKRLGKD
jgi:DNA-binding NtrC family response regulator